MFTYSDTDITQHRQWADQYFLPLFILGVVANLSALFLPILEPDGALYASIAKHMAQTNDFVNLYDLENDWLDKPHFPFWITALSFKLFGYHSFAYRIPALLFWMMGAVYTFKFARLFYNEVVAKLAVLIYLTTLHLVISNGDVRAEPFLTGLIIAAVFHFYKASKKKIDKHLIIGSLFAACAVMTKGPFVLITIGAGFIFHWLFTGDYKQFFHYRWVLAFFLIFIFIIPELYCLYLQFDAHPEKVIFGKQHVSGIKFFFWDSQFGRFLNTGPIKGSGDPSFYLHTLLWAFLPWSIFLYIALVWRFKKFRNTAIANPEYISLFGAVVTFLMFSLSRFQLPHYLNIVFPFFAITTASWFVSVTKPKAARFIKNIQYIVCTLLLVALLGLIVLYRFDGWIVLSSVIAISSIASLVYFYKSAGAAVLGSFMVVCILYFFLNLFFYPSLLQYQSGSKAAAYVNKNVSADTAYVYELRSYSFEFYCNRPVRHMNKLELDLKPTNNSVLLFTNETNLNELIQKGYKVKVLKAFTHFHISMLSFKFINAATRNGETEKFVLVRVL